MASLWVVGNLLGNVVISGMLHEHYVASDCLGFVALTTFVARDYLEMAHVQGEHLTCFHFLVVY